MGIRVIKTAAAAVAAVFLAQLLGLEFPMSAGLLAILGVESTIRKGVNASLVRIAASLLGLVLATIMIELFGFHLWIIALYLLAIIPVLNRVKLQNGLATCSVAVFHLFSLGYVDMDVLLNEFMLLLTGLGSATVINALYMPNMERQLQQKRARTEELFSSVFTEIAAHLKDHQRMWDGKQLLQARKSIQEGAELAQRAAENRLLYGDVYWNGYFHMREQQLDLIEQMLDLMAQVYDTLPQGRLTALLFEQLSGDVRMDTYTGNAERHLLELEGQYKNMPLPVTRPEFEIRSALFQITQTLHQYLIIAKREKKRRGAATRLQA
ncbi:aromatic acid exporter family protein [Paenibacillus koleovorans]|uniref:aromatic acid exporter family protein n=1 Tax=Paenibacillus koleovorans TaxID=121608 RepID=UPI000FDB2713|nr:aromatic acid exporter family protein [Paenibacillus koleovorans]